MNLIARLHHLCFNLSFFGFYDTLILLVLILALFPWSFFAFCRLWSGWEAGSFATSNMSLWPPLLGSTISVPSSTSLASAIPLSFSIINTSRSPLVLHCILLTAIVVMLVEAVCRHPFVYYLLYITLVICKVDGLREVFSRLNFYRNPKKFNTGLGCR